jgi:hypothetical protein
VPPRAGPLCRTAPADPWLCRLHRFGRPFRVLTKHQARPRGGTGPTIASELGDGATLSCPLRVLVKAAADSLESCRLGHRPRMMCRIRWQGRRCTTGSAAIVSLNPLLPASFVAAAGTRQDGRPSDPSTAQPGAMEPGACSTSPRRQQSSARVMASRSAFPSAACTAAGPPARAAHVPALRLRPSTDFDRSAAPLSSHNSSTLRLPSCNRACNRACSRSFARRPSGSESARRGTCVAPSSCRRPSQFVRVSSSSESVPGWPPWRHVATHCQRLPGIRVATAGEGNRRSTIYCLQWGSIAGNGDLLLAMGIYCLQWGSVATDVGSVRQHAATAGEGHPLRIPLSQVNGVVRVGATDRGEE